MYNNIIMHVIDELNNSENYDKLNNQAYRFDICYNDKNYQVVLMAKDKQSVSRIFDSMVCISNFAYYIVEISEEEACKIANADGYADSAKQIFGEKTEN